MSGKNPLPNELAYQGVKPQNPPDVIVAKRSPTTSDKYPVGWLWVNTVAGTSFQSVQAGGIWLQMSNSSTPTFTTLDVTGDAVIGGDLDLTNGDLNVAAGDVTVGAGDLSVTGTITATANIRTSTGDLVASAGDLILTAGDAILTDGDLRLEDVGNHIEINAGSALDFCGQATLVNGTVTIANTSITAADLILLSRISVNASTAIGSLTYAINAATNFVINSVQPGTPGSLQAADDSIVGYLIVRRI